MVEKVCIASILGITHKSKGLLGRWVLSLQKESGAIFKSEQTSYRAESC